MNHRLAAAGMASIIIAAATPVFASETVRPANQRFSTPDVTEVPDFQRHVLPLMGRLGCNSRSCHGSFQGQGGFRLSLFGYDFKTDREALLKPNAERVVLDNPEASKILAKPTMAIPHKGGKRLEEGSWQYQMLVRWIEDGAKGASESTRFDRLEVTPSEIVFRQDGEKVPLKVIAYWGDGSREDVTCITRFRTNDESVAEIDENGVVTSKGKGDTHIIAFYDNGVAESQVLRPVSESVGPRYPEVAATTKVDELVVAKLSKLGIVPSEVCSDSEFLRRVSLDMTGSLPTPSEVSAFLADSSPRKRVQKVEELLARPTYVAWWTNKLCDITGNTNRNLQINGTNGQPSRLWYEWIYRRVKDNMPYDELIAGIVLGTSRTPGQTYEEYIKQESAYCRDKEPADFSSRETMPYFWARRNLRTPDEKALGFSYTFLGVRLECAQCHKHPFDQWTQDDFKQFTAFFRPIGYGIGPDQKSREMVRKLREDLGLNKPGANQNRVLTPMVREGKPIPWLEVYVAANGQNARGKGNKAQAKAASGRVITPKLLGGDAVSLASAKDSRIPLTEWLRSKDNPYFARAFINRVWANYFGSGIINPPDDMNLANPPSNKALLDYLAEGFIAHGFDMKWLHREIVSSATYQRSWKTNDTNRFDERNFSRAIVRRLPAETLIDAVKQATATTSELTGTVALTDDRLIGPKGLPGANRRGVGEYAARVFGRSTRDTNCDCSRSNEPNLLQSIYLQNDQELLAAIERPGGWLDESAVASVKARSAHKNLSADRESAVAAAKRVEELERRLKKVKGREDESRVRKVTAQLESLRKDLKSAKHKIDEAERVAERTFDFDEAIAEAYRRTLSRPPTTDEMKLARDYFVSSADEAKGLRDLLWALLNTKEFITNH